MSPSVQWGAVTTADALPSTPTSPSIDAVLDRLGDPGVAASLVTLLDNAELLSTLVLGLSGFISRGEQIIEAVAEGVHDLKATGAAARPPGMPSMSELGQAAAQLTAAGPVLEHVLASSMVKGETIDALSLLGDAATEGMARAQASATRITGLRGAVRLLKDPEIQRGLGVLVEISRALGRRV